MNNTWLRIVILTLFGGIVGVPLAANALRDRPDAAMVSWQAERLVILTPHNEQILYEFARAFNRWRRQHNQASVVFDWRTAGGTSDLRKSVFAQFGAKCREQRQEEGIGCDLFFGGGEYEHDLLAKGDKNVQIALTIPINMPL